MVDKFFSSIIFVVNVKFVVRHQSCQSEVVKKLLSTKKKD